MWHLRLLFLLVYLLLLPMAYSCGANDALNSDGDGVDGDAETSTDGDADASEELTDRCTGVAVNCAPGICETRNDKPVCFCPEGYHAERYTCQANETVDGDSSEEEIEIPEGWEGVRQVTISAPDDRSVTLTFNRDPGADYVERTEDYLIDSDFGTLTIEGLSYDAASATLTLSTAPQKLGVRYTLSIADGEGPEGNFWSADERDFWVTDFSSSDYSDMQIRAGRSEVGEHCVIYVEDGYRIGNARTLVDTFDNTIYPTLTDLLIDAPDIDGNGKILLLALDGGDYYGGFFSPVNQYPESQTMSWWGLHSNEMEMIHLNVLVDSTSYPHVIAHEFQHLLYHTGHGLNEEYWEYHDEGLAESAIEAVFGENEYAIQFYQWDPDGLIADGLSLVHWQYAEYANYAKAFLFWAYVAGQISGDASAYGDIFDLTLGSPEEVDTFLKDRLDIDLPTAQQHMLAAFWLQNPEGPYGFNGLISSEAQLAPTVPAGTTSLDLEPFSGAFFRPSENEVNYPGTQGADIHYLGINGTGEVDDTEPFEVDGGVLLVTNMSMVYQGWPSQHSGPDLSSRMAPPAVKAGEPICAVETVPAWKDPPPFNPLRPERWAAWRTAWQTRR